MKPDTSHIETINRQWFAHVAGCDVCSHAMSRRSSDYIARYLCNEGRVLFDERCAAIAAHNSLESVEGKPCAT